MADKAHAAEKFDKSHARDIVQVFANGGVGALGALLNVLAPSPLWYAGFIGAMSTVNADTWATELGTLSKRVPRLITTGAPVEVGTSGGVSLAGTLAAFGGGLFIGLIAGLFAVDQLAQFMLIGAMSGLAGAFTDSLLGATVQRIYYDDVAGQETEKRFKYGRALQPVRGHVWMTNDMVNLVASLVGGVVAVASIANW